MPKKTGVVDGEYDDITLESAYYANKQGKKLPLEILTQELGEDAAGKTEQDPYSIPAYGHQNLIVKIATTYDRHQNYDNSRSDYVQAPTVNPGPRRYSCKFGNIPGSSRTSTKNQAATLLFLAMTKHTIHVSQPSPRWQ